jgi:hypothetical protein
MNDLVFFFGRMFLIYFRLASDSILSTCSQGKAQNVQMRVYIIWPKDPEDSLVSRNINLAVGEIVSQFSKTELAGHPKRLIHQM